MCVRVTVLSLFALIISMPGWATLDPGILPCPTQNSVVIGQLDSDVTGDGVNDRVLLMGKRIDKAGSYIAEMSIVVTDLDGNNELRTCLPKESDSGYDPVLKAMDFTGDSVPDVFISSSKGCYVLYSLRGGQAKLLLDTTRKIEPEFTGKLLPGYKAQITICGKSTTIDLREHKNIYDEKGYYKNGRLVKSMDMRSGPFIQANPVDTDKDGIYEIQTTQDVPGITNCGYIAEIVSILKWENGGWKIASEDIKKQ